MDSQFDRKLSLYMRSERAMLAVWLRRKARQLFWVLIALVACLTALILVDIGAFLTLSTYYSSKMSAFMLAGFNGVLCLVCIAFASRKGHKAEEAALKDIRDVAKDELGKDLKVVTDEVVEVGQSVGNAVHGVSTFFNGDFGLTSLLATLHYFLKHQQEKSG
ncbi:MAG: hypothetical protein P1U32_00365 [Legionellaceae bacterium]|nr:hypothetical protein [Legionellaceae bacterium]